MPKRFLDDAFVKALKPQPGQTGTIDYSDTDIIGLVLRLSPKGLMTWTVRYREVGAVNPDRTILGYYGEGRPDHLTLLQARQKAVQVQSVVGAGGKVVTPREKAKQEAVEKSKAVTVEAAVKAYLAEKLAKLKNDKARYQYQYGFDAIVAELGHDTPLVDVTRSDLVTILKRKAKSAPSASNRLRNKVQGLFRWASDPDGVMLADEGPATVILSTDPSAAIKKQGEEKKHRADDKRSLTDDELRVLLRGIQRSNSMAPEIKHILFLMALTSRRPNELCNIEMTFLQRWDHPEHSIVAFPSTVMKGPTVYLMPVNPLARDVIEAAKREWTRNKQLLGRESKYLFPTQFRHVRGDKPMSPSSVAQALLRFINESLVAETPEDAKIVKGLKADRPTPYALRRTVASGMAPLDIPREDRKAVMAHLEDDVLAGHYDKYDRMKEKRAALLKWETHVASLLESKRPALRAVQ